MRYGEQSATLKVTRGVNPFLAATNFSSCQATLRRLDKAFQAFFRRLKAGETPGYPRFKPRQRFTTVVFPSHGDGCRLDTNEKRVYIQHVGRIKVKAHRPVVGANKTLSVSLRADGWQLVVVCDLGDAPIPVGDGPAVGIDLGLTGFLATSAGETVAPPKPYRRALARLRRAQRRVARRQKGSNRRQKAVRLLAKAHQAVANQRRNFHHKTARALVDSHPDGVIVHEALNVRGIARTRLALSTHDAGWSQFVAILSGKAEEAGVLVVAVNPRDTSQVCSACGALPDVSKPLKDR